MGTIFLFGVLLICKIVGEGKCYVIVLTRLPELSLLSVLSVLFYFYSNANLGFFKCPLFCMLIANSDMAALW